MDNTNDVFTIYASSSVVTDTSETGSCSDALSIHCDRTYARDAAGGFGPRRGPDHRHHQELLRGDTCTTTTGEKVRLACIDTPELKGENAKPAPAMAAKYHLNGMLMSQKVGIRRITTDRYGRTVAELFINGANVQQSMVASGHAELLAICQPVPVDALIPPSGGMQALHQSPDRVICPDLSRTRTVIEDLPEASASQSTSQITALSMTHPNNQSKAIASEP